MELDAVPTEEGPRKRIGREVCWNRDDLTAPKPTAASLLSQPPQPRVEAPIKPPVLHVRRGRVGDDRIVRLNLGGHWEVRGWSYEPPLEVSGVLKNGRYVGYMIERGAKPGDVVAITIHAKRLPPRVAPKPTPTVRCVAVDRIIVNRHRKVTTTYDDWGRPSREFSETWWISFWDVALLPNPTGPAPLPRGWIDRGWKTACDCTLVAPCTGGWSVQFGTFTVFACELEVIDSPFDWELRHRVLYEPIK